MTDFTPLIDELAQDERERALIGSALEALAHAAPPVEPPSDLRARLQRRIRDEARGPVFTDGPSLFARGELLEWSAIAPGVEWKLLYNDGATGARTMLIRMAPDTRFPPHGHDGIEDLYLLEGDAWVGDIEMHAGDYCRAPAGSEHNDVRSGGRGALALVVSR